MALNIIIGLIVGLLLPSAEQVLKDWAEKVWLGRPPISDFEFDLVALLLILILASLLIMAMGGVSNGALLSVGVLIGLFGKRIWARIKGTD